MFILKSILYIPVFKNLRCMSFTTAMQKNMEKTDKFYNTDALNELSKEDLVKLAINFQGKYRQVLNKNQSSSSKLQQMIKRFHPRRKRKMTKMVDFESCMYRRIALKVAYLGWDYEGLQENENLDDTIERILREALRRVRLVPADRSIYFSRCGRTDKEVSAFSQVIVVKVRSLLASGPGVITANVAYPAEEENQEEGEEEDSHDPKHSNQNFLPEVSVPENNGDVEMTDGAEQSKTPEINDENPIKIEENEYEFTGMLNRVLPAEIKVLAWAPVENEEFSARKHCLGREYRYYFHRGNADITAMNEAAKLFCGLHDFRNFGKVNVVNCVNYVRRINHFEISFCDEEKGAGPYRMCFARIIGSGFIYHQVRSMMAVLYLIGVGLEKPEIITELFNIEKHPKKPWFGLVKPHALVLFNSIYPDLKWRIVNQDAQRVLEHFQNFWGNLALKSHLTFKLLKLVENDETIAVGGEDGQTHTTYKQLACDLQRDTLLHGVNKKLLVDCYNLNKDSYKKIMDRPVGKSLEEHLEVARKKKRKIAPSNSNFKLPPMEVEATEDIS
uniref:tRNA pseudouridine(38/39) synthase n=1 Tax=Ciona intestinalis TaxID=7719 RepID=UPI000180C481|nr:tRNA pseudouridine(38/39) synthase [Ciona intestinalis]|eukprot:XP_002130657.1 tRNA pseudouridine(38/39) synthase [Ciona intestinalis]